MINLSDLSIQPLIHFAHVHPYGAGIIVYFIVFLEAMAVVGTLIPGSILMPIVGFLIGSNVMPAGITFLYAITGAMTGDYLSYFIGVYFKERIHLIWPFTRWPNLLDRGEKYFHVHGGKSIFIGRFFAPTRAVIPMVAGMLKMPFSRFLLAAIPSAIIWVASHMAPGIMIGALSLELPPKVAAEFTLWALLILIALWLVVWLIKHFFKQVWQIIDHCIMQAWKYCQKHKILRWITEILADPRKPDNHQQLTLVIIAALTCVLFFFSFYQVLTGGVLTKLDEPIYHLLSSLRARPQNIIDYIAMLITFFGEDTTLAVASGLFLLWLLRKRYWYAAAHWLGIMVISIAVVGGAKIFLHVSRPGEVLYEKYASSFPSAHTALSLAFYGFLAVIIARESKKPDRSIPYMISGALVALIALSRLYLGVHWLSDILGSVFVGLAAVLLVTISYRRRHNLHFSAHKITVAAVSIFVIVWLGCSLATFHRQVEAYSLIWPQQKISLNILTQHIPIAMPLYRLNRLGRPIEAFNVEWVGDAEVIRQSLLEQGWKSQSANFDFRNILKGFFESSAIYHLPIFPQLYRNNPPIMILTKKTGQDDSIILLLRLWASDIILSDSKLPLWVGSVEYYNNHHVSKFFSWDHFREARLFIGATEVFTKYLKNFRWQQKDYSQERQPPEMKSLNWGGKLLVILPKVP